MFYCTLAVLQGANCHLAEMDGETVPWKGQFNNGGKLAVDPEAVGFTRETAPHQCWEWTSPGLDIYDATGCLINLYGKPEHCYLPTLAEKRFLGEPVVQVDVSRGGSGKSYTSEERNATIKPYWVDVDCSESAKKQEQRQQVKEKPNSQLAKTFGVEEKPQREELKEHRLWAQG